jgi:SAM-dependent methyltransferase
MGKNVSFGDLKRDPSFGVDGYQSARLTIMPEIRRGVSINLGCGFTKFVNMINVDKFDVCEPDVVHDLEVKPYPWEDNSVDYIFANHVFEHLDDWWTALTECSRILKPSGWLEVRVPDESSSTAMGYRDHKHIFMTQTFHGIGKKGANTLYRSGTNAWAKTVEGTVPLEMIKYLRVPFPAYNWMRRLPWLLGFCADHLRNFIWEQQFIFQKFIPDREVSNE